MSAPPRTAIYDSVPQAASPKTNESEKNRHKTVNKGDMAGFGTCGFEFNIMITVVYGFFDDGLKT